MTQDTKADNPTNGQGVNNRSGTKVHLPQHQTTAEEVPLIILLKPHLLQVHHHQTNPFKLNLYPVTAHPDHRHPSTTVPHHNPNSVGIGLSPNNLNLKHLNLAHK
jgi:hypothetical protein